MAASQEVLSGLSIGHVSPEAASKGAIALLKTGDIIEIDISNRKINAVISENELKKRQKEEALRGENAYKPQSRKQGNIPRAEVLCCNCQFCRYRSSEDDL